MSSFLNFIKIFSIAKESVLLLNLMQILTKVHAKERFLAINILVIAVVT